MWTGQGARKDRLPQADGTSDECRQKPPTIPTPPGDTRRPATEDGSAPSADRRKPGQDALLLPRRAQIYDEICATRREGLEGIPLSGEGALDCDALERHVQAMLRPIAGRIVGWGLSERVRACEDNPPPRPHCRQQMERPERRRSLEGLAGPSESVRGYYRCRTCGHHAAVADVVLSIGPGALTRASAGAALLAAQDPCGQAARVLNDTSAPT